MNSSEKHEYVIDKFLILLKGISETPGMYLIEPSIYAVSDYLEGYRHAVCDMFDEYNKFGKAPFFKGWLLWLNSRFQMEENSLHWTKILLKVYRTDQAAIEALPGLYEEFLTDRTSL